MNIVCLLQPVRGQFAAALAVAARIREQDGVSMLQQQLPVSGHTLAIVGDSVQQDNGIAVVVAGENVPAFQHGAISRGNA